MLSTVVRTIIFATSAYCANILVFAPAPFYSQQIAFMELWKQLSLRGHQVTLITTVPLNDRDLVNLTEIDMNHCFKIVTEKYQISKIPENGLTMWNWHDIFGQINREVAEVLLSHPKVQELINKREKKFDVVFVDTNYSEFLAFGMLYNSPAIVTSSGDANQKLHHAFGNPSHPVLHPDVALPFHGKLNFWQRLVATLYYGYILYYEAYRNGPLKQMIIDKVITNLSVSLEELISNADMLFLNVNPVIEDTRALSPTTINMGMESKIMFSKHLKKDLEEFMDNAIEGFIYLSLENIIKSSQLNKNSLSAIVEALSEVPYKVVWKFEDDNVPGKTNNMKMVKWAPQQIILNHPNIKLFITQGGLQSMEEAIYSKVPMVVVPLFLDQFKYAKIIETKTIGKTIGGKPSIRKEELSSAIKEVITNSSYRNSIRELGRLAKDFPMTGLKKAIWWTEYVIRNKGTRHLRNPAADIFWYEYLLLDVVGFLLLVTSVSILIVYIMIKKSVRVIINELEKKNRKRKKLQ